MGSTGGPRGQIYAKSRGSRMSIKGDPLQRGIHIQRGESIGMHVKKIVPCQVGSHIAFTSIGTTTSVE